MDDTKTTRTTRSRDKPQKVKGNDSETNVFPARVNGQAASSDAYIPVPALEAESQGSVTPVQKSEGYSEASTNTVRRSQRLSVRADEVVPVTKPQNKLADSSSKWHNVPSQPSTSNETEIFPATDATKAAPVRSTRRSARNATPETHTQHPSHSSTTQTVPSHPDEGAAPDQVTWATTLRPTRGHAGNTTVEPRVQHAPSSSPTVQTVVSSQPSPSNEREILPPGRGTRTTTIRPTRRSIRNVTVEPHIQHVVSSSTVSQPEMFNETEMVAPPEQATRAAITVEPQTQHASPSSVAQTVPSHAETSNEIVIVPPPDQVTTTVRSAQSNRNATVEPQARPAISSSTVQTVPSRPATSNETEVVPPAQGTKATTVQPARRSTRNATMEKTQKSEQSSRPPGPPHLEAALDIAVINLKSDVWGYIYAYLKKNPQGIPTIDGMKEESPTVRKAAEAVDKADRELQDAIDKIVLSNANPKGRNTERSAKPVRNSAGMPDNKPESSGLAPRGVDNNDSAGLSTQLMLSELASGPLETPSNEAAQKVS